MEYRLVRPVEGKLVTDPRTMLPLTRESATTEGPPLEGDRCLTVLWTAHWKRRFRAGEIEMKVNDAWVTAPSAQE